MARPRPARTLRNARLALALPLLVASAALAFVTWQRAVLRQRRVLSDVLSQQSAVLEQVRAVAAEVPDAERELALLRRRLRQALQLTLSEEEEPGLTVLLGDLVREAGLESAAVDYFELEPADGLTAVPVMLSAAGDRARLPLLLDSFGSQRRLAVLDSLEIDAARYHVGPVSVALECRYLRLEERATVPLPLPIQLPTLPPLLAAGPAGRDSASLELWARWEGGQVELEGLLPALRQRQQLRAQEQRARRQLTELEQLQADREAEQAELARLLPLAIARIGRTALGRVTIQRTAQGFRLVDDD